jgi:hypothetical protein
LSWIDVVLQYLLSDGKDTLQLRLFQKCRVYEQLGCLEYVYTAGLVIVFNDWAELAGFAESFDERFTDLK